MVHVFISTSGGVCASWNKIYWCPKNYKYNIFLYYFAHNQSSILYFALLFGKNFGQNFFQIIISPFWSIPCVLLQTCILQIFAQIYCVRALHRHWKLGPHRRVWNHNKSFILFLQVTWVNHFGPSGVRALPLASGINEGGHYFRY